MDARQHAVDLSQDLAVVETQNPKAMRFERRRPARVRQLPIEREMLSAVDLDDQRCFDAGEVGEMRADRVLAAELEASELTVAQLAPQQLLGVGRGGAKVAGSCARPHPCPLPLAGEGVGWWLRDGHANS
jgi:uncharacterized protein YaiL (DUF2058 family)